MGLDMKQVGFPTPTQDQARDFPIFILLYSDVKKAATHLIFDHIKIKDAGPAKAMSFHITICSCLFLVINLFSTVISKFETLKSKQKTSKIVNDKR